MSDINYIIKKCEFYLTKKDYIGLIEDKELKMTKKLDKSIINNLESYTENQKVIEIITNYYNLTKFNFYKTLELDLLKLYKQTNDKEIRNFICVMNQNLVISFVKTYSTNNNFEDIKQVGIIGLIKGIENFDCDSFSKLSTYACYWIKKEIIDYLYNLNDTIRKPKYIGEDKLKLNKFIDDFYKNNGYYPSEEEITKKTLFNEKKIKNLQNNKLQNNINIVSLDEQLPIDFYKNSTDTLYSVIADNCETTDISVENEEIKQIIMQLISNLTPNQQYVILHRYGFLGSKSLPEIARELNVSKQAVEQNEKRALKKLKRTILGKKYHF